MDDALEDGHAAANGEDQDGDDERPEVELLAVPEGVVGVGRLAAASDAEQQEQAVARVDQRVDPLGEHGRAAGYGRGDEFRHGDRQVAGDRGVDRALRGRGGHGLWSSRVGSHHIGHQGPARREDEP